LGEQGPNDNSGKGEDETGFTLHANGGIKFDASRPDVAALLVPRFNIAPRQDVLTVMQDGDQRVLLPALGTDSLLPQPGGKLQLMGAS
jgi:hypothetical protein